jgi:hypothetical protein
VKTPVKLGLFGVALVAAFSAAAAVGAAVGPIDTRDDHDVPTHSAPSNGSEPTHGHDD